MQNEQRLVYNSSMWVKLLLLLFTFSFIFRSDDSFNQDLGRHIKLGEIITHTRSIPKTNLFSYTNPYFPFINTHWLFEVISYWFSQTIGLQALLVLKVIIFLLSVWLIFEIIPKQNSALLLPVGFIFLHVLRERLELRPEIFSFLFTALTLFILERFLKQISSDRGTFILKLIFALPFIQLLWVNTHVYFFVGLILQAIFLIHLGWQYLSSHHSVGKLKLLTGVFGLSILLSLVNPNGLAGFLYPLNVTKNYGYTIVENQTMNLLESINFRDPNFLFVKISLGIILLLLTVSIIKRKVNLKNILLIFTGGILALINVRSFPYLFLLSFPALLMSLPEIKFKGLIKLLTILAIPILILESFFYLNGDYYRFNDENHQVGLRITQSVKGSMDFVISNNLPTPIFNNFDIGSYIIYRGYPKYPVFVDGRPEGYPKEFFGNTYIPMQSDFVKFKQEEQKWGFKTILFSHTDQTPWARIFLGSIVKDKNWTTVYIDDFMLVLVKNNVATEKQLKAIDLSKLDAFDFKFDNHVSFLRIGLFLLNVGYPSGRQFVEKALQIFPDSPLANSIMANFNPLNINFYEKSKSKFFW